MNSLPIIPTSMATHDNTMMSKYAKCQRLYALSHILHRRSIFRSPALSFGSLLHVGLDAYYRTLSPKSRDRNIDNVIAAAEFAVAQMQEEPFYDFEDDYRTRDRAIAVIIDYIKKYGPDQDFEEIIFTETAHDIRHPDGFPWGGITDLWVIFNGRDWIVDHKSTSRFGQDYFTQFRRDPQFMGYLINAAALRGTWPAGVIVNTPVVRKNDQEFQRQPIIFPHWLIEECRRMQHLNYVEIHEKRERSLDPWDDTVWRPNLYSCEGKYGKCEMYGVCHTLPENRDLVLQSEYEEKEWDWRTVRD